MKAWKVGFLVTYADAAAVWACGSPYGADGTGDGDANGDGGGGGGGGNDAAGGKADGSPIGTSDGGSTGISRGAFCSAQGAAISSCEDFDEPSSTLLWTDVSTSGGSIGTTTVSPSSAPRAGHLTYSGPVDAGAYAGIGATVAGGDTMQVTAAVRKSGNDGKVYLQIQWQAGTNDYCQAGIDFGSNKIGAFVVEGDDVKALQTVAVPTPGTGWGKLTLQCSPKNGTIVTTYEGKSVQATFASVSNPTNFLAAALFATGTAASGSADVDDLTYQNTGL